MRRSPAWRVAGLLVPFAAAITACGGDGRSLRPPVVATPATVPDGAPPVSMAVAAPTTRPAPTASTAIVIERLSGPANAIAEIVGTGGRPTDAVTVDGEPADVVSFETSDDGAFVARVRIAQEGAHTVCVGDVCGRVYTLAPDAETPEQVIAKIDEALVDVERYVDIDAEFPDWAIEIGGALAGTGGTTDVDARTITIYRNRGREVDEFVRTILHELGHAADADRLDDDLRAQYRRIRGIDAAAVWRDLDGHRLDEWAHQPSEDFAEAMVSIWSGGRWTPRTDGVGPAPDASQLAAIAALVGD